MKESVITVNFDVESEAYQALSEIKRHPDGSGYFVSAASLIKKENGHIGVVHEIENHQEIFAWGFPHPAPELLDIDGL